MNGKVEITAEAGATAALFSVAALSQVLARKGLVSADDVNEAFATAASMCRGNGSEMAAQAIELMIPTSTKVDVVALAEKRGDTITRK